MANQNVTYDVAGGVPYAVNLKIYGGSTFSDKFTITNPDKTAGGVMTLSLGSTDTANLKPGRYVYEVLVSSGATIYNIINGNVLVSAGIASAL